MNTTPVAAIIEKDGAPEYAVLPWADYQALLDAAAAATEDAADLAALAAIDADPDEEYLPEAMVDRLLAGENPLRVWRKHRRLKIHQLATATGTSESYLSQIETGKRDGSISTMRAYADALGVTIDDIIAATAQPAAAPAPTNAGRPSARPATGMAGGKPRKKKTARKPTRLHHRRRKPERKVG